MRLDPEREAAGELLPVVREHLAGERGRQGDECREDVDVVLDDF